MYVNPQHLPITYRVYPGSITDIATLRTTTLFLRKLGVQDVFYVLDRGFFIQENLEGLFLNGTSFVMPLPFTTPLAQQLLKTVKGVLHSPMSGFGFEDQVLFHTQQEVVINGKIAYAHLYFDEKCQAREMDRLIHQYNRYKFEKMG